MLRRNLRADFVGGAYVFPGGAVDANDRSADIEARVQGLDDTEASARLGVEQGGLGFWAAAVRETFEEAGILLAVRSSGADVELAAAPEVDRFDRHRRALAAGERTLLDVLEAENLVLDASRLHVFSHWITPAGMPRRYDTWFFVAAAPPAQHALHDDSETVASTWIRPRDALASAERGEMELIFPTIRNLAAVSRFERAADLVAAAAAASSIPTVRPKIVADGPGMRLLLPGEPGYDAAEEPPEDSIDPRHAAELDRRDSS